MRAQKTIRKIIAAFVAFVMLVGMLPGQLLRVHAGAINISKVLVYGEYDRYTLKEMIIQITASGDPGSYPVLYDDTAGKQYTLGSIDIPQNNSAPVFKAFTISGADLGYSVNMQNLYIGDKTLPAIYSQLPSIKESSANLIDDGQNVTLGGERFDRIHNPVNMDIEGAVFELQEVTDSTAITINNIRRDGNSISQNIVFWQEDMVNGASIKVSRKYASIFRVVENMNMDLKYTPTRGEGGSTVYISFNNPDSVFDDYSVFFLKDSADSYTSTNLVKASDISYTQDRKIMKVKVPANLPTQEYIIQLTNPITSTSTTANLGNLITKRQNVGKFFITAVGNSPIITVVDPASGPNNGDIVEIVGKNFEELSYIEGFSKAVLPTPVITKIFDKASTSLIPGDTSNLSGNNVEKLQIFYPDVENDFGERVDVTRKITVYIGVDTEIQLNDCVLSSFTPGDDSIDVLRVKTKKTSDENKTVDVLVTVETEIEGVPEPKNHIAIKEQAYTFIPSYTYPTIDQVLPERIQVGQMPNGTLETKEDMVIGILGKNFKVYRYTKSDGTNATNYPIIGIGGDLNNNNGEIVLKRIGDRVYTKSAGGEFDVWVPGAMVEILNDNGVVVDGTVGNDTGTSILVTLPKGRIISIVGKKPVAIKNPILKGSGNGNNATVKYDAVEFVTVSGSSPTIDSVVPIVTTMDAGELVTVKGSNFDKDVRVFIAGREVPKNTIKREVGTDGRSITIKFNALKTPLVKEGSTKLMLMNPDGGIAVSDFTYVRTFNQDPKLTGFAPDSGTENTAVVVDGDNFMKPNPAVSSIEGVGIYQIIGSRILMDGIDVNEYETNTGSQSGTPVLTDYKSPNTNLVLQVNTPGSLTLSDYYHSVIFQAANQSYFILDVDRTGGIYLTGGGSSSTDGTSANRYDISLNPNAQSQIIATRNGVSYEVYVYQDRLELHPTNGGQSVILNMKTVFKKDIFDAADGSYKIIGNRVKVTDKNRLVFTVPYKNSKLPDGFTITIQNPDTKKAAAGKLFYYYSSPKSRFKLTGISPNTGSVDGGYWIDITGEPLDALSKVFDTSSRAYINGTMVSAADTKINSAGTVLSVLVPKYSGNLSSENLDSKSVPVIVANEDGGTAYMENGFTYLIPSSHPKIADKGGVFPATGSAAGGYVVEIKGTDFRFFEPKSNRQEDENWRPHRDSQGNILFYYRDVDNYDAANRVWDGFSSDKDVPKNSNTSLDRFWGILNPSVSNYNSYVKTNIIPRVYFGAVQAKVVEFDSNRGILKVIAPPGTAGETNVYLVNNDWGTSNKVKFTYTASNPKITSITPAIGKKQGREPVEILGSSFSKSSIRIYDSNGVIETTNLPLVRFGDITNRDIPRNERNSGLVNGGKTEIELNNGTLKVVYDALTQTDNLEISATSGETTFSKKYTYDEGTIFVPLSQLTYGITSYPGYELLRLEFNDGRLIVEGGYSPEVQYTSASQLVVRTPSYYTVGKVNVYVVNPDGGTAKTEFEYKNPDSNPSIINVLKEENQPLEVKNSSGVVDKKVQKVSYKGGNIVTVVGTQFRENATIKISDVVTIDSKDIIYNLPSRLTFTMPTVPESAINKELRVIVINEDGGTTSSDETTPPIYIIFTKGETVPTITKISPDIGPSSGGTRVKIEGKEFREVMEGIPNKTISVYFGEVKVPITDVKVADYKTIYVNTPPHSPGKVKVKVENPDGELAASPIDFTYLSNPKIASVVDPADPNETQKVEIISVEGGQEIKLKGAGFLEGAKVYFSPKIKAVNDTSTSVSGQIIYIEGKPYNLESGNEGTSVVLIDGETLRVTTPKGVMDTKGILVVNSDGGASNIFEDLIYSIPALEAPTGVRAELVYDRYIRVYWTGVPKAKEYEIQAIINDRETELVGVTALTSFMYEDLKADTSYKFIVKAVGDLGSSKASNESNTVKTGTVAGRPNTDGNIGDTTGSVKNGETATVNIGTLDYNTKNITIDLTRGTLAGSREVVVSIPASVIVKSDAKDITVIGKDFTIVFNPAAFAVSRVKQNQTRKDAGVKFKVSPVNSGTDIEGVSGFTTALSPKYLLQAEVFVGSSSSEIDYLNRSIQMVMDFNVSLAETRKLTNIGLYRYDDNDRAWSMAGYRSGEDSSISLDVGRLGKYMVIGRRR